MKILKNLSTLMLLIVIFIFISCGTSNKKSDGNKTSSSCANFQNKKGYKAQKAIVLDFVNVSKSKEFEYLSTQIADNIYRDVNMCFTLIDNSYIRNYITDKGIPKNKLNDKEIVKEIGINFSTDLVIFGTYTIADSEIQIIGEITSIENESYNDFKITSNKDNILSDLDDLSMKVANIGAKTFPPKKINEKNIEKDSMNIVSIMEAVDS